MKKHSHLKIISSALIIAFVFALTRCSEETGDHGMVWINPGDFTMGDDSPGASKHQVTLTKGFYMSRYLITEEQFSAIMGYVSPNFNPENGSRFPANGVSWYEVIVFCNKLSIQEGLEPVYEMEFGGVPYTNPEDWINITDPVNKEIPTTNNTTWNAVKMRGDYPDKVPNGYRLPTEAEWEYACRAGADPQTLYNTGDSITTEQANFGKPSDGSKGKTTSVGSYAPNAWGLYDMHGNVYEWCWNLNVYYNQDPRYDPGPPPTATNPTGEGSGSNRVIRGGAWNNAASEVSSAYRNYTSPVTTSNYVGFRVVRP